MPFEITISINAREIVGIKGRNCGSPTGDRELPTRIYHYIATHQETGEITDGEVLHERTDGIERLAAIILNDLAMNMKEKRRVETIAAMNEARTKNLRTFNSIDDLLRDLNSPD
jgi:hypothetical protein